MQDGSYYGYTSIHPAPRVRIRFLSVLAAVAIFGGFFWLAWYAYKAGTSYTAPTEVPLVEADDVPFRTRPEDPGGMVIPHQDKTVYDAIASNPNARQKQEKLLSVQEEATPSTALSSEERLKRSRQQIVEELQQEKGTVEVLSAHPAPEPETVLAPLQEAAPVEAAVPAMKAEEKKAEAVKEAPATPVKKIVPKEAVKPPSASGHRLQLGAFKTKPEADSTWLKIRRQHTETIGAYSYDVEKADLGAKGIFYRLRLTGLKDNAEAQSMCKKLAARQQGCFVVEK